MLPDDIATTALRELSWRMALIKERFHVSSLVAEALASAELHHATILLEGSDVGERMLQAAKALGVPIAIHNH